MKKGTSIGHEVVTGILRIYASFEGVALEGNGLLSERKRVPSCYLELPLDKVLASDHFCDWMLLKGFVRNSEGSVDRS
jgi:hypothetical protein